MALSSLAAREKRDNLFIIFVLDKEDTSVLQEKQSFSQDFAKDEIYQNGGALHDIMDHVLGIPKTKKTE